MPPIPLSFGPSTNKGKFALDASARVVNAHAIDLGEDGKAKFGMYAAPGLKSFASIPTNGYRGGCVVNSVAYVVYGRVLYSVDIEGDVTEIGAIPGNGYVPTSFDALANPHILFIASGRVYVFRNGVFSLYQSDALPPVVDVDYIYGRFVFATDSGQFWYSDIPGTNNNFSLVVNGLNVYGAENKPDGLRGVRVRRNEVWLFGKTTVDVWSPTQNTDDPFSPLGSGALPYGCISTAAVAENNDLIFWIDQNYQVRSAKGYQPDNISRPWVSRAIAAEPDPTQIVGYAYTSDSQQYYEISGQNFTARFNLATGQWTERQTLGSNRWRGNGTLVLNGMTLVGDVATGDLWQMDSEFPYDGDKKIVVTLQSGIQHAFPMPLSIYSLHVDVVSGAHDDGSDPELADPQIALRLSDDGGKSYDGFLKEPLWTEGNIGRVVFRQLGTFERSGATIELSYWSGICRCVMSAVINGTPGST